MDAKCIGQGGEMNTYERLHSEICNYCSRNGWVVLGLLLLLASRMFYVLINIELGPFADEDNYARRGAAFVSMLFPPSGTDSSDFVDAFYNFGYWPPLFSIVIGPVFNSYSYEGLRLFLACIDIASGVLFFLLAQRVLSARASLYALYLYTLNPFIVVASYSVFSEVLFNFLVIATLLLYAHLMTCAVNSWRLVVLLGTSLGLVMGAAYLTRSAFLLIFAPLMLVAFSQLRHSSKKMAVLLLAAVLMFVLTIPWNMLIKEKEGRFMFMHTISAQQLYMKFAQRGGSWNATKEYLQKEAAAAGMHPDDFASTKTAEYFQRIGLIAGPIKLMLTDLREKYLFIGSGHEARMRLGLYDSSGFKHSVQWFTLIWHELVRFPMIILGALGLLSGAFGVLKYRPAFLAVAIGFASAAVLGSTSGRHFMSIMPMLVLGASAVVDPLRGKGALSGVYFLIVVFALSAFGFNIWQNNRTSTWTVVFQNEMASVGRPPEKVIDSFQFRRIDDCQDKMFLLDDKGEWLVDVYLLLKSGAPPIKVNAGEELILDDYVAITVQPTSPEVNSTSLKYIVDGKVGEIPIDRGRTTTDWSPLPNTCLRFNH